MTRRLARSEVSCNDKLSLEIAAAIAFPDGTVTARILREAIRQGKIQFTCIGKKYYTTLAAIEGAYPLCHAIPKAAASTSGAEPGGSPSGQSVTEAMKSAQAALKINMEKLKKSSRPISPPSTGQTSATVIRPRFPSRTSSRSTPRKEPR